MLNRTHHSHRTLALITLLFQSAFVLLSAPAHAAAESSFFRMNDQFNERFTFGGTRLVAGQEAVGLIPGQDQRTVYRGPAASYFSADEYQQQVADIKALPPPPFDVATRTLRASSDTLELELNQVATIKGRGIKRFATTSEGRVEFYLESPDALQIQATTIGNTFVHIWDDEGRVTFPVHIIPSRQVSRIIRQQTAEVVQSNSFKIEYDETRSSFYTGNAFEDLRRNSLAYAQSFALEGDTPYGGLTAQIQIRKDGSRAILSSLQAKLSDFHLGNLKPMDITVGDFTVNNSMYILPSGRFRGLNVDYAKKGDAHRFTAFYGRELNSVSGTLSSGNGSVDAFIGGIIYDWQISEEQLLTVGYLQGSGQQRSEDLNRRGIDVKYEIRLNDYTKVETEYAFDNERFAFNTRTTFQNDNMIWSTRYRDVSKFFRSVIGSPGGQGEQGVDTYFRWDLNENMEFVYDADIFRDRISFDPGKKDRFNVRQNAKFKWNLGDGKNLTFSAADTDESAFSSPTRSDTAKVAYSQVFMPFGHKVRGSLNYTTQDNESLTNPDSFYRRNSVGLAASTQLPWDFKLSYGQNITYLEETNLRLLSHPRTSSLAISRTTRIPDTPITFDFDFRYTDQEETESGKSFLSGEDSVELSSSLRYQIENIELYIDGRYSLYRADNIVNESRTEAEVISGVRYTFDTGYRWEPETSFHGVVYQDINADNIRQADEPGMPDMTIFVGDEQVVTDAEGRYKTPKVKGKRTSITLNTNSIPYGFVGTSGLRKTVYLNDSSKSVDFGLVAKSSIQGIIYNDMNSNGKFNRGEVGVQGVRVILEGTKQKSITNANGAFSFDDVVVGEQKVAVDLSTLRVGFLPSSLYSKSITLSKGVRYRIDFGVKSERSIGGQVYIDLNNNNQFDSSEKYLAGAEVLFGDSSAISDDEGYYLFTDISVGTHTLTIRPKSIPGYSTDFALDIDITGAPIQRTLNIRVQTEA